MKTSLRLLLVSVVLFSWSCSKDSSDDNASGNNNNSSCTSLLPNKVSATINNVTWCADSICFADYSGLGMTIFGQTFDGASILLELDDVTPGVYTMGTDVNYLLYIDSFGMAYESTDDNPGEIVITQNNTSTNSFKARFNVVLRSPLLATSLPLTGGNVDVLYTE
jgi:hypothetical protein